MRGLCLESQLAWSHQDQWVDQNIALLPKKVDIKSFLSLVHSRSILHGHVLGHTLLIVLITPRGRGRVARPH